VQRTQFGSSDKKNLVEEFGSFGKEPGGHAIVFS